MTNNVNYVQAQKFQLFGSGVTSNATSIQLQSFKLPPDNTGTQANITLAMFGTIGYATLEPGTVREENISFTSVVQNSDGSATLGGVTRGLQLSTPYTTASNYQYAHAGGAIFIITDNAPFLSTLANKANDETITGQWTFNTFPVTPTNSNASATVAGVTKLSVAPVSSVNPIAVGDNDVRVPVANPTTLFAPISITGFPVGFEWFSKLKTVPSGWLEQNAQTASRTGGTAALFAALMPSQVCTISIATPAVISATAHGFVVGDQVSFTTTGGLPSGLAVGTVYYVITAGFGANSFELAATLGGSAINTTGSQSGVHTMYWSNHGIGDGSTTFNVPDMRGYGPMGLNTSDTNFDVINSPTVYAGEKTHALTLGEGPAHTHTLSLLFNATGGSTHPQFFDGNGSGAGPDAPATSSSGSGTAHNNLQPYKVGRWLIKT